MDRAQIRIELLRIVYSQRPDDNLALDIAKRWEPWVLEALSEAPSEKPKKPANPARS